MNILKSRLKRGKIVILFIISYIFAFFVHFFIDFILSYDGYYGGHLLLYLRINLPIIFFSVIYNIIIVILLSNTRLKKHVLYRFIVEFGFVLILDILQVLLFQFYDISMSLVDSIIAIFENKFIYTNTIQNYISILSTEFLFIFLTKQEDEIYYEKILIDNERYKYNQLKSQINPHFLFNSLNILAAMVYKKKDEESGEYIEKLSDVYRYVLTNEEKKVITLKSEIEFIEKYIGILKSRFKEGLIFEIDISTDSYKKLVPTMSLQLLVENCIKHNIVSKEQPIIIKIYSDGDYIIVSNNKNLREEEVISTGIGLKNLDERYRLIANKSIEIINQDEVYKVKIPLI